MGAWACAGHRAGTEEAALRLQLLESLLGSSADALPPDLLCQGVASLLGLMPAQPDEDATGSSLRYWLDEEGAAELNSQLQGLMRGADLVMSPSAVLTGHTVWMPFNPDGCMDGMCTLRSGKYWLSHAGEDYVRERARSLARDPAAQPGGPHEQPAAAQMPGSMAAQLQRAAAGGFVAALGRLTGGADDGEAAPVLDDAQLARLLGLIAAALRCRAALQRAAAGQPGRVDPAWAPSGSVLGSVAPALKLAGGALVALLDGKSSVTGHVLAALEAAVGAMLEAEDVREQLCRCAHCCTPHGLGSTLQVLQPFFINQTS